MLKTKLPFLNNNYELRDFPKTRKQRNKMETHFNDKDDFHKNNCLL